MRILTREAVAVKVGLSARTIEELERDGDFPRRRQLSPRRVGWVEAEVDEWIEQRPAREERILRDEAQDEL